MSERPSLHDLDLFAKTVELLAGPCTSMREVAKRLDVSSSTLTKSIQRLERCYDQRLLRRSDKMTPAGPTAAGQRVLGLLDQLSAPFEDCGAPPIRMHVSQMLLTGDVIGPCLVAHREREPRQGLDVRVRADMDFDGAIADLRQEAADLVLAWGVPERMRAVLPGIRRTPLVREVQVVVVAHDPALIQRLNEKRISQGALQALRGKRLALLPRASQVGWECLPAHRPDLGDHRMEVSAFDQCLALVRARAADAALVPAVYQDLLRYRHMRLLHFSQPVAQVPLCAFSRESRAEQGVSEFLKLTERTLQGGLGIQPPLSSEELGLRSCTEDDPGFVESLRWGYYVGGERGGRDAGALAWCWEELELERAPSVAGAYAGRMVNQFGEEFELSGRFVDGCFVLEGRGPGRGQNADNSTFLAMFTSAARESGVLCGMWSGRDSWDQPGVFGAVLSREKLSPEQLRRFALAYGGSASLHVEQYW